MQENRQFQIGVNKLMTNLVIELYKYQAESERKRIIERQQQGISLAKKQGKYHGRKPQYAEDDPRLLHAFKLYQVVMSDVDVARNTGIKRTTFIRYRKKYSTKLCWIKLVLDNLKGDTHIERPFLSYPSSSLCVPMPTKKTVLSVGT